MVSYEHKVKNIYLGSPYNEGQPLIPGDYTLLRGPCDEGFHVPLKEEWDAIINAGVTYTQFKVNLHIPLSGKRDSTGGTWDNSGYGYLWISNDYTGAQRYKLYLSSSAVRTGNLDVPSQGYNVRGFRNTPIIPDETRTATITNKVWYNSDLGLISVLVGTNQYVTLQDKNVGATVVYNSGDTIANTNRGKYFQRGNNYGFTWNSSGDTSSTLVDASNYGPSNPYSSSTFIMSAGDWSTVENGNLRGYTDFNS